MVIEDTIHAPEAIPQANPNLFLDTLKGALAGIKPEDEAPAPEAPPVPAAKAELAAPVAEDPLAEMTKPDAPDFKLPIDEETPAAEKEDIDPDQLEIKAGRRIKELKDEIKIKWQPRITELEQSKAQLESRVAEMEARLAATEELETKVKTYEEEMSVVKLERHPKYIAEVRDPLRAKVAEATALAKKYDIPTEDLLDALEMDDGAAAEAKLEEITSGLDVKPFDLLKLLQIHGAVKPILAKRDEMMSKADQVLLELQHAGEKEVQQASLARAEERKQITPLIAERMKAKLAFISEDIAKFAEATAATDIDALDTPNRVYNHMAGLALPKALAKADALKSENDRLLDELTALKKALPRLEGGLSSGDVGEKPKDFLAAIRKDLGM